MPRLSIALAASLVWLHSPSLHAEADCDKSDRAAGRLVADLGHLMVHDEGNDTDYSFAVCETFDVFEKKGRVTIVGSPITSSILEVAEAERLAREAQGECISRGAPYSPSGNDQRLIEYHLCQRGGRPSRVEVVARTVDQRGIAHPTKKLSVPWPDLRSPPARPQPFVELSSSDKSISCESNEQQLGQLAARDEGNLTTYRFVVCRTPELGVAVRSNFLTGTIWDQRAIGGVRGGSECLSGGAPYGSQGPGDERSITYRLCGHGAAAPTVEVDVVPIDAGWHRKPAAKLSAVVPAHR